MKLETARSVRSSTTPPVEAHRQDDLGMHRLVDLAAEDLAERAGAARPSPSRVVDPAEPPTNISPMSVISASAGQLVEVDAREARRRHHRGRLEDAVRGSAASPATMPSVQISATRTTEPSDEQPT